MRNLNMIGMFKITIKVTMEAAAEFASNLMFA